MLVVTLDGTPLLGTRTGIGRYVHHLVDALPREARDRGLEAKFRVTTWSARRRSVLDLPPGVRQVGGPIPARLLRAAWARFAVPTAEIMGAAGDVVHGTNFVAPPTRSARTVVTVHDLTFLHGSTAPSNVAYRELVPTALRRGAHVVTPSRAVADAVAEEYGLADERLTVTPLGVDPDWFDAGPAPLAWLREHGLPQDYILYVGSADPRKNVRGLIRAHGELRAQQPDAPALVLAGPAGSVATPAGRQEGVHRAGYLDNADLRRLVAGCRVLVLPSFEEGFGLPVLEALATGRPVVVSDIPALREVAGPHAVAAPTGDVTELAAAIERALGGPDDERHRTARRSWARQWTWQACAAATLDVYLKTAGGW